MWEYGVMANGYRVSSWSGENVLELIVVTFTQSSDYIKNHRIIQLKMVTFMVCGLYLN